MLAIGNYRLLALRFCRSLTVLMAVAVTVAVAVAVAVAVSVMMVVVVCRGGDGARTPHARLALFHARIVLIIVRGARSRLSVTSSQSSSSRSPNRTHPCTARLGTRCELCVRQQRTLQRRAHLRRRIAGQLHTHARTHAARERSNRRSVCRGVPCPCPCGCQ